jgi:acetyl esterase/lipase
VQVKRAATLLLMLLDACSPVGLLNALAPRDGVTLASGIAYGDRPRQMLDAYIPSRVGGAMPMVVFFYGGGWQSGSKEMYRFVGAALAACGVLAVIPDYRLYPEVRFPDFVYDAASAVAWTRQNAARLGGDPHRVFLMGHSAGGQIATLLALDPRYLRSIDLSPRRDISGVIGLAGAYDFLPLRSARLKAIFGPEGEWRRSQPIDYVSAQAPPMLLLAGRDDNTVDPANTLRLATRLRAAGGTVEDALYPGVGHKALIAAFAGSLVFLAPVRPTTMRFIAADECTN